MNLHDCNADIEANYKPVGDADPATAIAPGGAVPLRSPTAIGFYRLTILASFFQTIAAPLNASIFAMYLHGAPPTVAQLTSLQAIAWSLRVAFATGSDTIELGGYRRKFWLLMGWVVATTSVAAMAFSDFGPPYCDPKVYSGCMRTAPTSATSQIYDLSAPNRVRWYRVPTFFSAVGMVMVQSTLDGAMVEIAHREPLEIRGQFQTIAVLVSGIGAVLTRVLLQFGFNEKRYGGNYDYSAGPHVAYCILFGLGLLGCVATALRFEDTHSPIHGFPNWCRQLWTLLQTRAVYQLLAFRLLTSIFQSPTGPSVMTWVTNLDFGWANVVQRVPFTPTLILIYFKGMGWNWRKVVFITTLGSIVVTAIPVLFVTWNVCRNAYFYVLILWLSFVGVAANTLMPGWAMVEVAGVGHEATIAAIYATIKDLVVPITTRWRTYMAESFPANLAQLNDDHTQNQVGYNWIVCLGIQVAGLVFIALLPTQRKPLLEMKARGELSVVAAVVVILAYIALFAFDWQQNLKDY